MSYKNNNPEEYYNSLTEDEDRSWEDYEHYNYYETYETNKFGVFLFILLGTVIGALIMFFIYGKIDIPFLKEDTFLNNDELKIQRVQEVLTKMYDTENIETVIQGNEDILSYFDTSLHPLIDISIEDNYVYRYTEFANEATSIDFLYIKSLEENEVLVMYEVSTEYSIPSRRLAKFKFNESGLITGFEEYRIYLINE